jgi:hypothetical protein
MGGAECLANRAWHGIPSNAWRTVPGTVFRLATSGDNDRPPRAKVRDLPQLRRSPQIPPGPLRGRRDFSELNCFSGMDLFALLGFLGAVGHAGCFRDDRRMETTARGLFLTPHFPLFSESPGLPRTGGEHCNGDRRPPLLQGIGPGNPPRPAPARTPSSSTGLSSRAFSPTPGKKPRQGDVRARRVDPISNAVGTPPRKGAPGVSGCVDPNTEFALSECRERLKDPWLKAGRETPS